MYVYFCSLHVSGSHVPIIRRIIVSCDTWFMLDDRLVRIPETVWYAYQTINLLMMGTWLPETCRE